MTKEPSIVLVGKNAYYWSYMAPIAREFKERFGRPVPAISLRGEFGDTRKLLDISRTHLLRRWRVAIAFDVWSLVVARLLARRAVYVHHSLVGKGLVFRGEESFWPFQLADLLCLPLTERVADLPLKSRAKARVIGHIPFDWLEMNNDSQVQKWMRDLAAWTRDADRPKVAILCTHGPFGSAHLLNDLARLPDSHRLSLAVKFHGYIDARSAPIPPGVYLLGTCPTSLVVRAADIVITDHSTAVIEASILGVPSVCFRGSALKRLQQRYPALSELQYLDHMRSYEHVSQLQAILSEFQLKTAAKCASNLKMVHNARAQLLDVCLKEVV